MDDAFGLYIGHDRPGRRLRACAAAAVRCGVRHLQLRMKGAPRECRSRNALHVREITLGSDTLFIVTTT